MRKALASSVGMFALALLSCSQSDNGAPSSAMMAASVSSSPTCRSYSFTKIADSSDGQYAGFSSIPSINSNGTITFTDSTQNILLAGDGTKLQILYQAGDGFFTGFGGHPSINNSGTVAFLANTTLGGGIFSGNGNSPTTIANDHSTNVKINEGGTVAFALSGGMFIGSGGATITIVDANGPLQSLDDPSINNAARVAFHAGFKTGGFGIFVGNGSTLVTVADSSGPFLFDGNFGRQPSINSQSTVAFLAKLDNGETGVFKATNGTFSTIVDSTGPFSGFEDQGPSINNRGIVAFRGFLDNGGEGIFVGPDPSTDKVIAIGDALFGKTVNAIGFGNAALNDKCQIAFFAKTNNDFGIYRADPKH